MHQTRQLTAVEVALRDIDSESWSAYGGGWPDSISYALIDAVFSIRATYRSDTPGRGVLNRLLNFRDAHQDVRNDLEALESLGEEAIRAHLGDSKTCGRLKSEAVLEAAANLRKIHVVTAQDFKDADRQSVKKAYTDVHGLGWITYEYFTMLLGVPGVKADRMIVRFVNRALEKADLPGVDALAARQLVIDAYDNQQVRDLPEVESLTHFEHAIWLTESNRAVDAGADVNASSPEHRHP
jgi:hypothetical protein